MSIDPQNPLFRYIDKAIVALAGLVLLWAVSNAFSSKSPAVDACDTVREAMQSLDKRVKDKRWDGNETGQPQHYAKLSKRFSADSMPEGDPFREAVFYSPDAILGDPMTVRFRPSRPDIYYYMIKDKYAKDFPALAAVNYATAEPAIVKGGLNIAELSMDVGRKAIIIIPRKEGKATVRIEFFGGTSFTFLLQTIDEPVLPVPEPEQPLNVAATGHRGYVSLKWNTNPESCPAILYIIYRSDALDKAGVQVLELAVNGREMPPKDPAAVPTLAKAMPQQYEWDDMAVNPGTQYYYTIKTRGLVKREEKEEIETSPASDQVKAMPSDSVALFLTSGMEQMGMANIEVVTWHGYVPRSHTVRGIRCGQRVRDMKIDTGYTLIAVEQLPRQVIKLKPVIEGNRMLKDDDGNTVMEEVRTINTSALRAILVDESNQVIEIWGPHRWMRGYEKKIDDEFEKHPKDKCKPLPKVAQNREEIPRAELAVTNDGDTPLTFLTRSRKDRVIKDIPPYSTRVFELEQDDYEMLGIYREEKRKDDLSFHKEKVTLRKRTRYELGFKKPKKELPTEPEKPADVDGDGGGPEGE
jgi:hypothetical protein